MTDEISTILIGAGGVFASKDILNKLLGPTADYLGDGMRNLAEKSAKNLGKVFLAMRQKLKSAIDIDGEVNGRVFKTVWDEARFVDDSIAAEYFAGILSSARTADGKDDSALPFASILREMSTLEIRLHFILYNIVARCPFPQEIAYSSRFWNGLECSVTVDELLDAMKLERNKGPATILMTLRSLVRHNLVKPEFSFHFADIRESCGTQVAHNHVVVFPNETGASLFLRALGLRGLHAELLTSLNVDASLSESVRDAVRLPCFAACRHRQLRNPLEEVRDDLEMQISNIESAIDEVKQELAEKTEADEEASDST